jgi:SWI/SNF-related matrix-associated actin-dependent regulator of chromatin subfamily A3
VLYPIAYLNRGPVGDGPAETVDWACVRTQYEHDARKEKETIHIRSPNWRTPAGEQMQGENFAVMEQRVATVLGPMLGKGLIRIEARIRRGLPNVSNDAV